MIDKKLEIEVTNRDNGIVGYEIPDMGNLHRRFAAGETKTITYEELEKLSWIPGGQYILKNLLKINNEEAIANLLGTVEPEYNYGPEEGKILLSTQGSLDQLKDALQYGPRGVVELIKSMAVESELNDVSKRAAILEATGFDISRAIEINHESKEEVKDATPNTGRRTAPITTAKTPQGRKANPVIIKK